MKGFEDFEFNPTFEDKELTELRRLFNELCENGPYTESFQIRDGGIIALDKRAREDTPPLLANLFAQELRPRDVEIFYRLFRGFQQKLPEFEFSISEDPSRTSLNYRVAKRAV
jgi:hypothetical protein